MGASPIAIWRETLHERAREAVSAVGALEGVIDVVVGGSLGRGDEWAFSDIDLIPITAAAPSDLNERLGAVRSELTSRWASTELPHVLDVGWLAFTSDEVEAVLAGGVDSLAAQLSDPRWLYGSDKAAGGWGCTSDSLGSKFASFAASTRFHPAIRRARFDAWMAIIDARLAKARAAWTDGRDDDAVAAAQVAGPLSAAALEAWGEREGGVSRFASRFERIADAHRMSGLAGEIGQLAGSAVEHVLQRGWDVPAWLESRIELGYLARLEVAEPVTPEQNRRDHLLLLAKPHADASTDVATQLERAAELAERVRALLSGHQSHER